MWIEGEGQHRFGQNFVSGAAAAYEMYWNKASCYQEMGFHDIRPEQWSDFGEVSFDDCAGKAMVARARYFALGGGRCKVPKASIQTPGFSLGLYKVYENRCAGLTDSAPSHTQPQNVMTTTSAEPVGKCLIGAMAPNGNHGLLAVWGLQDGDQNGRYLRWYNGDYDTCASPGCDFYIESLGNGKYKIEAVAPNGNRGPLAVWGLQDGDQNGRHVRWYNGDYASCASPGCDFYITSLGNGKYRIEAEAPNGNRGPLAVWGLQNGDDNGRHVRWYSGDYDSCASPGCDFYISCA